MGFEILENCRLAIVNNIDNELIAIDPVKYGVSPKINISGRVYPHDSKMLEKLDTGAFPLVTFTMNDDDPDDPCGRNEGVVQFDVVYREQDKKLLWDVHNALRNSVLPRVLLAEAMAALPVLNIRVAYFRQQSADDSVFDERTNTHRLRSVWNAKFVLATL